MTDHDEQTQLDLDLWPRTHDLPPRWDGAPVEWAGWQPGLRIFVCGPRSRRRPEGCSHCGDTTPPAINVGRIWTATTPTANDRGRPREVRELVAILTAFRCTDCNHDSVLDPAGALWDLDPTDYTDAGSRDSATH